MFVQNLDHIAEQYSAYLLLFGVIKLDLFGSLDFANRSGLSDNDPISTHRGTSNITFVSSQVNNLPLKPFLYVDWISKPTQRVN